MMSEKVNAALIILIYEHIPNDCNPAAVVADTLNIGREAAYRRLRGEVLFTFGEAAELASRFRFSLDRALGTVRAGSVLFHLQFRDFYSTLEEYNEILGKDIRFFREVAPDTDAVFATAGGTIPAEFYMRHPHLAKFKFFKWLYQHGLSDPSVRTFEEMSVPAALERSYGDYVSAAEGVANTCYVFDNSGFKHWVNAILAFRAMHLISDQSIRILKKEMALLLDEIEAISVSGQYASGNKVMFYLSDIDLESTYSFFSSQSCKACRIGVFSLNSLRTSDPDMFDHVKRWIQTQTRFSTLISESGELQRIHFFKRQRAILTELEREDCKPSPEAVQG